MAFVFFVTSNPLSGYEGMPFEKAVNQARKLLNANVFQNPRYSVKHGKRVKLMNILLKLLEKINC
jgi:hypothetical protein